MSGSLSSVEGELNAVIKEFLEYSKLERTLSVFEEECQRLGKAVQEHGGGATRMDDRRLKIKSELLEHFDCGRRTEFFSEWEAHVSPSIEAGGGRGEEKKELEFRLQIHFAVLPMRKVDHWCQEDVVECMVHFRYFLESSREMSDRPRLLPFFALPYVHHPHQHPSFTALFQESWVPSLRSQLDAFLFEGLKGGEDASPHEPRLIELYHNRDLDLQDARKELQYLERHIEESEKRSVLHAKKCEKLQEECRQLMAVASLLVTALENAVKGNLVDMDCVLSACATHLPDLDDRLRPGSSLHSIRAEDKGTTRPVEGKMPDGTSKPAAEKLDFGRLKQDLRTSEERKKCLLLQALRWRLTRAVNWQRREEDIVQIVVGDLLDIHSTTDDNDMAEMFLGSGSSVLLVESFVRFLNALSSFVMGRQYLTSRPRLLHLLVECLLGSAEGTKEPVVRDMILGTLKKLSIRRCCQGVLVELGVVEWLSRSSLSPRCHDYGLHASVALLFNLSLCPPGKKRCEPLKVELISGLGKLLQLQDSKISPYVNGILYRILSIPSVREYAKDQLLPSALRKVMLRTEGEPKKQLETILELFVTDVQIEDGSSDEEDEDQENDSVEPEIDANDKVRPESVEAPHGEQLLQLYYERKQMTQPSQFPTQPKGNIDTTVLGPIAKVRTAGSEAAKPGSTAELPPTTPKVDVVATQLVRRIVPHCAALVEAASPLPRSPPLPIRGCNTTEYTVAFSSRPKIPRTPEPGDQPPLSCHRETVHC